MDVALDVFDVFAILAPQTRAIRASGVSVWLGRSASAASKRSSVGAKLIWLTAARHAPLSQINHEAPSDHGGGVTLGWGTLAAGGQLSKAKGFTTAGSTELRSGRLFRAERAAAASAASKRAGCECGGLILGIHGQHNHSYLWRLRPDDARRFDAVQLLSNGKRYAHDSGCNNYPAYLLRRMLGLQTRATPGEAHGKRLSGP